MFINSELKPKINEAFSRTWGSDAAINSLLFNYNNMPIVYVPKSRFYTAVTLNDGTTDWGYDKATSAKSINFMIVQPSAVLQAKKFCMPKIFSPDENQTCGSSSSGSTTTALFTTTKKPAFMFISPLPKGAGRYDFHIVQRL